MNLHSRNGEPVSGNIEDHLTGIGTENDFPYTKDAVGQSVQKFMNGYYQNASCQDSTCSLNYQLLPYQGLIGQALCRQHNEEGKQAYIHQKVKHLEKSFFSDMLHDEGKHIIESEFSYKLICGVRSQRMNIRFLGLSQWNDTCRSI